MQLADSVYAVRDLHQEYFQISYDAVFGSLPNKRTDDLQTVCNPVIGLDFVIVANKIRISGRSDPRLHVELRSVQLTCRMSF
jgi:hypothetical protein